MATALPSRAVLTPFTVRHPQRQLRTIGSIEHDNGPRIRKAWVVEARPLRRGVGPIHPSLVFWCCRHGGDRICWHSAASDNDLPRSSSIRKASGRLVSASAVKAKYVRFGSLADALLGRCNVRLAPTSRHSQFSVSLTFFPCCEQKIPCSHSREFVHRRPAFLWVLAAGEGAFARVSLYLPDDQGISIVETRSLWPRSTATLSI